MVIGNTKAPLDIKPQHKAHKTCFIWKCFNTTCGVSKRIMMRAKIDEIRKRTATNKETRENGLAHFFVTSVEANVAIFY